jgi:sugar lactone lactonase YvrE
VITDPLINTPSQAIFDSAENLYVADYATGVFEIPAGTSKPVSLNLNGFVGPSGIALDEKLGRLYVSDVGRRTTFVYAYKLGVTQPLYHMVTVDPDTLAFGGPHFEYLFVPSFFGYEVDVYKPNGRRPLVRLNTTYNSQGVAYKPPKVP